MDFDSDMDSDFDNHLYIDFGMDYHMYYDMDYPCMLDFDMSDYNKLLVVVVHIVVLALYLLELVRLGYSVWVIGHDRWLLHSNIPKPLFVLIFYFFYLRFEKLLV